MQSSSTGSNRWYRRKRGRNTFFLDRFARLAHRLLRRCIFGAPLPESDPVEDCARGVRGEESVLEEYDASSGEARRISGLGGSGSIWTSNQHRLSDDFQLMQRETRDKDMTHQEIHGNFKTCEEDILVARGPILCMMDVTTHLWE